jgi:hypothetical protein
LHESPLCSAYLDTALTNGFLQIISKATRIQNNKASLIDHIFSNSNLPSYSAGTIIDDLSDHFCNFIQLGKLKARKQNVKESTKCLINEANTNNLKNALNNAEWAHVFADNDANSSFNKFWDSFNALYDLHFPLTRVKFNKNKHRINAFMTDELLNK